MTHDWKTAAPLLCLLVAVGCAAEPGAGSDAESSSDCPSEPVVASPPDYNTSMIEDNLFFLDGVTHYEGGIRLKGNWESQRHYLRCLEEVDLLIVSDLKTEELRFDPPLRVHAGVQLVGNTELRSVSGLVVSPAGPDEMTLGLAENAALEHIEVEFVDSPEHGPPSLAFLNNPLLQSVELVNVGNTLHSLSIEHDNPWVTSATWLHEVESVADALTLGHVASEMPLSVQAVGTELSLTDLVLGPGHVQFNDPVVADNVSLRRLGSASDPLIAPNIRAESRLDIDDQEVAGDLSALDIGEGALVILEGNAAGTLGNLALPQYLDTFVFSSNLGASLPLWPGPASADHIRIRENLGLDPCDIEALLADVTCDDVDVDEPVGDCP